MRKAASPLTQRHIIRLLTEPTKDRRPAVRRIMKAPLSEVLKALQRAPNSDVRHILCDVIGFRKAKSAVSSVVKMLDDPTPGVRSAAADALAKIRRPEAGAPLAQRFSTESHPGVRAMYASALGAVGHRPAIPLLVTSLSDDSADIRQTAAWALGHLGDRVAEGPLRQALQREADDSVMGEMIGALQKIRRETARSRTRSPRVSSH
jgi:HEAT repeat protein